MKEKLKLKYTKIAKDILWLYHFLDDINQKLITSPLLNVEEKLNLIKEVQKKDIDLYNELKKDIEEGKF